MNIEDEILKRGTDLLDTLKHGNNELYTLLHLMLLKIDKISSSQKNMHSAYDCHDKQLIYFHGCLTDESLKIDKMRKKVDECETIMCCKCCKCCNGVNK